MAQVNFDLLKRSRKQFEFCTEPLDTRKGKYPRLTTPQLETAKDQPSSKVLPKSMCISWDAYHKLSKRHTTSSKATDELLERNWLFLVTKKPTSDHETTEGCEILGDFNTWGEALQFFQKHRRMFGDKSCPTRTQKMEVDGDRVTDQTVLRAVGPKWDMSIVMHCIWDEGIVLGKHAPESCTKRNDPPTKRHEAALRSPKPGIRGASDIPSVGIHIVNEAHQMLPPPAPAKVAAKTLTSHVPVHTVHEQILEKYKMKDFVFPQRTLAEANEIVRGKLEDYLEQQHPKMEYLGGCYESGDCWWKARNNAGSGCILGIYIDKTLPSVQKRTRKKVSQDFQQI
ncbi:hypothetical protein ACEPPN_008907 [Leptodophora sp. 'Broadleaf-Isolate-01']